MSEYRVPGTHYTIREIMNDPRRRKETAENELTALLADILLSHGITLQEWEMLSTRYWNRRYPGNPIKAAQEKTNAARALTMDSLTWNRFDEFIQCLGAVSYDYVVELHYADGREPSTHRLKVRNRYKDKEPAIELQDEDNTDDDDLRPVGYDDAVKALHTLTLNMRDLEPYIHTHLVEKDSEDE